MRVLSSPVVFVNRYLKAVHSVFCVSNLNCCVDFCTER